jgi:pimeloyl-ACP methyl ester carboxylesterase
VRNSTAVTSPLVIFFGGSGSESSEMIPLAKQLTGWSVALINYRGFGLSEGTPSEAHVQADALFIYDTLSSRTDIDSSQVVSMGYSLGTGVAVYLSSHRQVSATILAAPFDKLSLIGLKESPIYLPLKGIMKPYFNSIALAPIIQTPLLCLIGSQDRNIPPDVSLKLVDAWGGVTEVKSYLAEDHSFLFHENSSLTDIKNFLSKVEGK